MTISFQTAGLMVRANCSGQTGTTSRDPSQMAPGNRVPRDLLPLSGNRVPRDLLPLSGNRVPWDLLPLSGNRVPRDLLPLHVSLRIQKWKKIF